MKANKAGVATILENSFQLPAFVANTYDAVDYTNFSITPNYLLPWTVRMDLWSAQEEADEQAGQGPGLRR